jgi:hypothetical protein
MGKSSQSPYKDNTAKAQKALAEKRAANQVNIDSFMPTLRRRLYFPIAMHILVLRVLSCRSRTWFRRYTRGLFSWPDMLLQSRCAS